MSLIVNTNSHEDYEEDQSRRLLCREVMRLDALGGSKALGLFAQSDASSFHPVKVLLQVYCFRGQRFCLDFSGRSGFRGDMFLSITYCCGQDALINVPPDL